MARKLSQLVVVELDKIVRNGLQVVVEVSAQLGQCVRIARLSGAFHLHKVVLHAVNLFLTQLSHELGDLRDHVVVSICLREHLFVLFSVAYAQLLS